MEIKRIEVNAGRTYNHPYESYSNLRADLRVTAELAEGEDVLEATKALQAQAEQLVENHKQAVLHNLDAIERISHASQAIKDLEDRLEQTERALSRAKETAGEVGDASRLLFTNDEIPF